MKLANRKSLNWGISYSNEHRPAEDAEIGSCGHWSMASRETMASGKSKVARGFFCLTQL